jgi:hopanoid-associated phosphorylase
MILAATGLRREARLIASPQVQVIPGGGRSAALEAALLAAAPGAEAVISIGIGGALAPHLRAGDWVVAERIVWPGGAAPTDTAWTQALLQRLPGARAGVLLGSEAIVTDRAAKADAQARFGALAVDMESQVAARVAQRLGVPFAAARVIADDAELELPPAAAAGMRPDGRMAVGAVLWSVARQPQQLPALIRTGLAAERALRALADGRRLLGPRLGLADLGELALDVP